MATITQCPSVTYLPLGSYAEYMIGNITNPYSTKVYWYAEVMHANTNDPAITTPKFYYNPDPLNNNRVIFDPHRILDSYCEVDTTPNVLPTSPVFKQTCNDYILYRIHVGERDINGVETDTAITGFYVGYKGVSELFNYNPLLYDRQHFYVTVPEISAYNMWLGVNKSGESQVGFELTQNWDGIDWNGPTHYNYADDDNLAAYNFFAVACHGYTHNVPDTLLKVVVKCKDGQYKVFNKDITSSISTSNNFDNFIYLNLSANTLNSITFDWSTVPTGKNAYIDWNEDDVYAVMICGKDAYTHWVCRQRPILFRPICSRYRHYTVAWKTNEVTWDNMVFAKKSHEHIKSEKTTYSKLKNLPLLGGWDGSRGKTIVDMKPTKTITLNTGWLDDYGISQIQSLIESKFVYILVQTTIGAAYPFTDGTTADKKVTRWIPVIVNDATYDLYDRGQDKLVSYTITFSYAINEVTI